MLQSLLQLASLLSVAAYTGAPGVRSAAVSARATVRAAAEALPELCTTHTTGIERAPAHAIRMGPRLPGFPRDARN